MGVRLNVTKYIIYNFKTGIDFNAPIAIPTLKKHLCTVYVYQLHDDYLQEKYVMQCITEAAMFWTTISKIFALH